MNITRAEAEDQAAALQAASADSPVTAIRYSLQAQASEWNRAAKDLGDATDGTAVLAGSLVPGMLALYPTDQADWQPVSRILGSRDGQFSYVLDVEGRAQYINRLSVASPVVVKR